MNVDFVKHHENANENDMVHHNNPGINGNVVSAMDSPYRFAE